MCGEFVAILQWLISTIDSWKKFSCHFQDVALLFLILFIFYSLFIGEIFQIWIWIWFEWIGMEWNKRVFKVLSRWQICFIIWSNSISYHCETIIITLDMIFTSFKYQQSMARIVYDVIRGTCHDIILLFFHYYFYYVHHHNHHRQNLYPFTPQLGFYVLELFQDSFFSSSSYLYESLAVLER